jgi:hypothetical protein
MRARHVHTYKGFKEEDGNLFHGIDDWLSKKKSSELDHIS